MDFVVAFAGVLLFIKAECRKSGFSSCYAKLDEIFGRFMI
jgi:hypothetical protein